MTMHIFKKLIYVRICFFFKKGKTLHFHESISRIYLFFFDISGERQSLMFLQQLINHSLQVLGLWKVVCSHGFELLSRSLTPEDQNMIRGLYFRDLIISLSGKEVCGKLIQALISVYLGDDARTGENFIISRRYLLIHSSKISGLTLCLMKLLPRFFEILF